MSKEEKEIPQDIKDATENIGLDLTGKKRDSNAEDSPQLHINLLKKQLEESEKKYLLLYADFENYKKRVQKEKEDLTNNTKIKMLEAILDMDNDIFYALKTSKSKENSGINLIAQKLEKFLLTHGVQTIQTETYDDDLHEVISVMEIGETKVIDVASKGYTINGKPFRYPKIVLGK